MQILLMESNLNLQWQQRLPVACLVAEAYQGYCCCWSDWWYLSNLVQIKVLVSTLQTSMTKKNGKEMNENNRRDIRLVNSYYNLLLIGIKLKIKKK